MWKCDKTQDVRDEATSIYGQRLLKCGGTWIVKRCVSDFGQSVAWRVVKRIASLGEGERAKGVEWSLADGLYAGE